MTVGGPEATDGNEGERRGVEGPVGAAISSFAVRLRAHDCVIGVFRIHFAVLKTAPVSTAAIAHYRAIDLRVWSMGLLLLITSTIDVSHFNRRLAAGSH